MIDVQHVLYLKKNLIFLGTLNVNGCRYTAEGGVIKVSKGTLVVMKGTRSGNMYILQGTAVIGAAVISSSSIIDSNIIRIWDMKFG